MIKDKIKRVKNLIKDVKISCLGSEFKLIVSPDKKFLVSLPGEKFDGRIYIQVEYEAPCTKTGEIRIWKGRKYYLSDYMTEDEVIKTAFTAFKQAVEHEVLEGFKVSKKPLFNPHTPYTELLSVSGTEMSRDIRDKKDLQYILQNCNYSVTSISKSSGVNRSLISQYKSGTLVPSEDQSMKVLEGVNKLKTF